MNLNAYLAATPGIVRPWIKCADGFTLSVQAGAAYPSSISWPYTTVCVGYPSEKPPTSWDGYYSKAQRWQDLGNDIYTNGVYDRVPIALVKALIDEHGGIGHVTMQQLRLI